MRFQVVIKFTFEDHQLLYNTYDLSEEIAIATREHFEGIPEQPGVQRKVVDFHIAEQARNPDHFEDVAHHVWESLSEAERDAITAAQAAFFPHDIEARQQSIRAQLVGSYMDKDAASAEQLENDFLYGSELADDHPGTDAA